MLGFEYQSKRGYIGLDYYGRTARIKIMPFGIHKGHTESMMKLVDKESRAKEHNQQFEEKTVLLGVHDIDIFKGINLKLLAMEQMLKLHPYCKLGYRLIIYIDKPLSVGERVAYYSIAECVVVKSEASKGLVVEKIFTSMDENGKPVHFVLCVGNDRSTEDMFEIIENSISRKEKYYLDDTNEVILMLESMVEASDSPALSKDENYGSRYP
ncbi:unnamed protein product [Lactuca saligna]|uniref:Uncharacterized protein n=1 Tax=Lactuca saligna TaxID=75948 RepID=A0AA36E866_LACSI|nr:unnamed protein product [Lactuca saligna]